MPKQRKIQPPLKQHWPSIAKDESSSMYSWRRLAMISASSMFRSQSSAGRCTTACGKLMAIVVTLHAPWHLGVVPADASALDPLQVFGHLYLDLKLATCCTDPFHTQHGDMETPLNLLDCPGRRDLVTHTMSLPDEPFACAYAWDTLDADEQEALIRCQGNVKLRPASPSEPPINYWQPLDALNDGACAGRDADADAELLRVARGARPRDQDRVDH